VTLTDNGANSAGGTATDKAGNTATATATVSGINIDKERHRYLLARRVAGES
jgi:hypothetical protein